MSENTGPLTKAEEIGITLNAKVTLPTRPITERETPYTRSEHTNLAKTFARIRAQLAFGPTGF